MLEAVVPVEERTRVTALVVLVLVQMPEALHKRDWADGK